MKKLKGFTLAEVLITLTIVGLIAALTLPTLNANIQKNTVGPSLAKAINTLENANRLALQDNEVSTLSSITNGYPEGLSEYINGSYYSTQDAVQEFKGEAGVIDSSSAGTSIGGASGLQSLDGADYGYNGTMTADVEFFNKPTILTQDGILYTFKSTGSTKISATSKYYGSYYVATIDINGNKKPNSAGKDQFKILVDLYGSVIPVGGRQYMDYTGGSSINWQTTCKANATPTNYDDCAGAIVDNSYKVTYLY